MAGSSLLLLIDDIAAILDDVAVMSKVAAKKTAGVLGDDLALNAQQVAGVKAERELPVVWAVAKGSLVNKVILVPAALAISALAPWAVTPLLMLGGAYLCFEGVEKIAHKFLHPASEENDHREAITEALAHPEIDLVALEREKIKGAIRTDFILSAEIIVIALGTVAAAPFLQELTVLALIAVVMTVGVYGLVAGIVKLDDVGMYLMSRKGDSTATQIIRKFGWVLLKSAPALMKFLSVAGTLAMFLVGGSILVHGIPSLQFFFSTIGMVSGGIPVIGLFLDATVPTVLDGLFGVVVGAVCVAAMLIWQKVVARFRGAPAKT
jgi:predicted DNA repair protein MutK